MQEKKKVLIIDDEEMHLYTAKGLLENELIDVITYKGTIGATSTVKKTRPDLVLLDINMPALSGDNLVGFLKPFCDEMKIPILFYSSNDEDSLSKLAASHGVQGFICKGDVLMLRTRVKQHLSKKPAWSGK